MVLEPKEMTSFDAKIQTLFDKKIYRPVQDTFKKYLNADTFMILSEKVSRYRDTYFYDTPKKKYLNTNTFKILSEKVSRYICSI